MKMLITTSADDKMKLNGCRVNNVLLNILNTYITNIGICECSFGTFINVTRNNSIISLKIWEEFNHNHS